jgi:hypothetical protein
VVLKSGEFGRGRDLPADRIAQIDAVCHNHGITRHQALSLRRQLLRAQHGNKRVNQSQQMGDAAGQLAYAHLFEDAVEEFLRSKGIPFLSQKQQLGEMKSGLRKRGPTPDVLFTSPTLINDKTVCWLDCKAFYGTALLAGNRKLPVGKLSEQAYARGALGEGGFVFTQGFNADLYKFLVDSPSVLLLDATPLDLRAMDTFQAAQV